MKKFLLLSIVIISLLSCEKDDEALVDTDILGEWKLENFEEISGSNGEMLSTLSEIEFDCLTNSTLTFYEDNKLVIDAYFLVGGGCSGIDDCNDLIEELKYEFKPKQNQLIFIYNPDNNPYSIIYTIEKINANQLHFSSKNQDYNNDGVDDKLIYKYVK